MLKGEELKELIQLIDESSITEFSLEEDGASVTIKKQIEVNQIQVPQQVVPQQPVASPATNVQQESTQTEEQATTLDENVTQIVSPMVGTFYRKPSPESDSYVEVGAQVSEESIVCIVEAMKLFNEIEAEVSGEIVEILVGDGELVEFGQPLFNVRKN